MLICSVIKVHVIPQILHEKWHTVQSGRLCFPRARSIFIQVRQESCVVILITDTFETAVWKLKTTKPTVIHQSKIQVKPDAKLNARISHGDQATCLSKRTIVSLLSTEKLLAVFWQLSQSQNYSLSLCPITTNRNVAISQSELEAKMCNQCRARENIGIDLNRLKTGI